MTLVIRPDFSATTPTARRKDLAPPAEFFFVVTSMLTKQTADNFGSSVIADLGFHRRRSPLGRS